MNQEPIALIGIGCRFPGAENTEAFWQLLQNGVDAITEVPADRWDNAAFYDPDIATPGKMNTRWGGFLEQVDHFDPQFFGIAPKEVVTMDPQQRLLLEVAWEALEDAAQPPEALAGTPTGVFIGVSSFDYYELIAQNTNNFTTYTGTGTINSIKANRLSYCLDLRGPSMAIDTACSSSLVAVHLACQSLWTEESSLALVGGVHVMTSPWMSVAYAKGGFIADDGRCKTFDARADGYVRSEGAGVVVLKPLSQALVNGDRIYALIRGSATNQDGYSNGLTAPNPLAQAAVLRAAYGNAGVSPAQVQYIEAHGTGTKLGDPMEMQALATVLSEGRDPEHICRVGSAKTNIGHLEAGAGIAGLIKVALALHHRQIPPSLHFVEPNPYIPFDQIPLRVQTELGPWPQGEGAAIAGVSSFGFGGANAHVVLEAAPVVERLSRVETQWAEKAYQLLTLSAQTPAALAEVVARYEQHLQTHPELELADICYTAQVGRSHFNHRLAVVTASVPDLQAQLQSVAQGQETPGVIQGQRKGRKRLKVAFLFTGQGSQYVNMGLQLYQTQPVFRAAIDQCDQILRAELDISLLEVLYPDLESRKQDVENREQSRGNSDASDLLDQTAYTQPALFAIEYALAQLWQSWGIQPAVVMGHSVGEYVAACVAGVLSLEDGLKLIAARGRLMQQLPTGGAMVSVMASEEKVRSLIPANTESLSIAAINGPESVVISGDAEEVGAIATQLDAQGIKTKSLQVYHAFHSPLMEPILAEFAAVAERLTYHSPRLPLISNVTGAKTDERIATANYWVEHIRRPVQFARSMETLADLGYHCFLEIGPKPILLGMGRQCLAGETEVWLPSLRPPVDDQQQIFSSLGQLYVRGVNIDWSAFNQHKGQKVALPTYPFQRQRYWIELDANGTPQNSTSEGQLTPVLNLLHHGKTQQLAQQLATANGLSSTEIELLPKLLDLLAQQHRQQLHSDGIEDLLYQTTWRPQGRLGQLLPPRELQSPSDLAQQLCPALTELTTQIDLTRNPKLLAHLEQVSVVYIVQALQALGWSYQPGDCFTQDAVVHRLGIVPSQRRLFYRMLQILAEVDILQSTGEQWQVLAELAAVPSVERTQQWPQGSVELTLLERCAPQLSGVLKGAVDPVQLVFPSGDLTTATQLYQETPTAQVLNTLIQQAITQASQTLPPQRGLRVLEIGAGTGGTTRYILPHLDPSRTDYVFTDISSLFLAKAQEKFRDYPFVRYQTLDIEVEPVGQGFEADQFDVIVAANVLHATADMTQTLTHVRQLLAPGGMLVLLEVTTPQRWLDLIFGLLEGWWKFSDLDLRPDYPLLSQVQWQQLLNQTGFSQVVGLPDTADLSHRLSHHSVILAQADPTPAERTLVELQGWLILADHQGVGEVLASQLESDGATCVVVKRGDRYQHFSPTEFVLNPHHPDEFEQLLTTTITPKTKLAGVIQCWPLEAEFSHDSNTEDLEHLSHFSCGSTLFLVQALVKQGLSSAPRLWIVTQGAQPAPNSKALTTGIAQASIWGMGKVIQLEHPEFNCTCVDLAPQTPIEQQALELWSEIGSQNPENQVALRADGRYIARLERKDLTQAALEQSFHFREQSTYLITGGLGGVGLLVADWMVRQGARHFVLVTRRPPDESAQQKLACLEQAGVQVLVETADVSDRDAMASVFAHLQQSAYPLAGIIHAAGLLSDSILQNQSWSSFAQVMAPKVQGAWHLHCFTQHQPLDFFVLFSSTAALIGVIGAKQSCGSQCVSRWSRPLSPSAGLAGFEPSVGNGVSSGRSGRARSGYPVSTARHHCDRTHSSAGNPGGSDRDR